MVRAGRRSIVAASALMMVGAALVILGLAACSRDSIGPRISEGMKVRISVARGPAAAPAMGPVDSLRFDVRGPDGELLTRPVIVQISPGQTTFSVNLPAPPGTGRSLTVMAMGFRPVSGDGGLIAMPGILYRGRADGIDIEPGNIPTVPIALESFVPEFTATDDTGDGYTIHWRRVPGAVRYVLVWGVNTLSSASLTDSLYHATGRPMQYQVTAVDQSGLSSAPSDWLVISALPQPDLCVTSTSLDFGTSQTTASFAITNCGTGGTLSWTAAENIPWLSLDVTSGSTTTESDPVTVTVDRSGLTPGSYTGTITISSAAGNATVNVMLQVLPVQRLCVDATALDFPVGVSERTIHITNCGSGGTLTWTVSDDQPFIVESPVSGSTTTESDAVSITVDRAGLAPGTHTGTVTVSSNGGDVPTAAIPVSVDVPASPQVCVNPSTLDFGTATTSMTFNVTNCGAGTLNWTLNDNQPWITVSPVAGTTTTESDPVTVTVNRTGLAPGSYTGTVSVSSGGSPVNVTVTLTVPDAPALCASPPTLDFGTDTIQMTFNITNCGNTPTLNWTVQGDQTWINAAPASGTTGTETDAITVTVDRTRLAPGSYTGHVVVRSEAGSKSVDILMQVPAVPALCVDKSSIDFGTTGTTDSFTITNCGTGGTLDWSLSESLSWLTLNVTSGSTTTESDVITLTVNRGTMPPGPYTGAVTVNSQYGTATVNVSMQVPAVPALCVSRTSMSFGASATVDSFTIRNCGTGGTLNWTVSDGQTWLSVNPTSGSTTTEGDPIFVTVDRAGLAPAIYNGTVTVTSTSPPASATVSISMQVLATPQLCVNTNALDFGAATTSSSFTITNCGNGGTVTWNISDNQPWLTETPTTGSTTTAQGSVITVNVNRSGLNPGSYSGTITVNSQAGSATIGVTMDVTVPPALCPDPPSLNFGTDYTQLPLYISNCGGGTLTWSITADRTWITVIKPSSGTTTTETDGVTIGIDRASLPPGTSDGNLTISWNNGQVGTIPVTATIQVFPPAAPTNLSVTYGQTFGEIILRWTDNASNETGYEAQRGHEDPFNGQFVPDVTFGLPADTQSYVDHVGCGTYLYRVRAYNAAGSSYSNVSDWVYILCAK